NKKFPPRAALEEALCFGWIDGWFKPHRHGTMGDSIHAEAKEIQLVQVQHSNRMEFAQSAEDDLRRRCETTEGCSSQRNFPSAGRPRLQAHMGTSVVRRWDLNPRSPVPETSLCNLLGTPDKQAIYWLYYLLLNTCSAAS